MTIRSAVFWLHLALGVLAGAVVAVMSITGIAIAFEQEILAWCDRNVAAVELPGDGRPPLSVAELRSILKRESPGFAADHLVVEQDPRRAWQFWAGRSGPWYIDPYTGELRESRAHGVHEAIHFLEDLHRWLAIGGEGRTVGRLITGTSNLAFLLLCITGIYLWFPKRWSRRAVRYRLRLKPKARGKARDFNWHLVFGFWSLPVLVVLAGTGVVISFAWAHNLVFRMAGETPPEFRDFRMTLVPPFVVPPPSEGSERLPLEALLKSMQDGFPGWQSIRLPLADLGNTEETVPVKASVTTADYMPNRAFIPVELNPYTGEILRAIRLQDRSAGLQARIWIRFLHTGAAFGVVGKIIATLATVASLFLVYTGYALSYRRFFSKKRTALLPAERPSH